MSEVEVDIASVGVDHGRRFPPLEVIKKLERVRVDRRATSICHDLAR